MVLHHTDRVSCETRANGRRHGLAVALGVLVTRSVSEKATSHRAERKRLVVPELAGRRVGVLDDDPLYLGLLERVLTSAECEVRTRSRVGDAVGLVAGFRPHLVVMDADFGEGREGVVAIALLRGRFAGDTRWVLHSASPSDELERWAAERHADGWIRKGGDIALLLARLAEVLKPREE